MTRWYLACGILTGLCGWTAVASAADGALELERIARDREQAEAQWQQKEQACQERFAVQACLDGLAAQRRAREQALQAQEAAIHAAQRQQRAQEQSARIAEKQRSRDEQAAPATTDGDERLQAQRDKVQAHRRQAAASASVAPSKDISGSPSAAARAQHREAYAAKQRTAQEHREARDRRMREATGASQALPLPR